MKPTSLREAIERAKQAGAIVKEPPSELRIEALEGRCQVQAIELERLSERMRMIEDALRAAGRIM